jgi:ornithine carbamoyltransferase
MHPSPKRDNVTTVGTMAPSDVEALLDRARALQHAVRAGTTQPLLRGKNLGLLCDAADERDAELFQRAAVELGAHVALLRPGLSESSTPQEVQHTARMLGRFYDAVECQGMAPALVLQMGHDAGVPVYDGIASQRHPTAALATLLGDGVSPADNRRFVVQALLLNSLT